MSQTYDVFLCHRGPETKRNIVSVLSGMFRSKGITCFVDYRMDKGKDVNSEIDGAIQTSRVFIVILSPEFATSTWCLEEVLKIMNTKGVRRRVNPPVVPVFCDVQRSLVQQQAANTSYDLSVKKGRYPEKIECWSKALKDVGDLDGFVYETKTMPQWEISEAIVARVESYLSHNIITVEDRKMPISRECVAYDVFICHWRPDTQLNAVSVLRGILLSRGITPFVVGYGKNVEETESMSDVLTEIKGSKVHIVFLSPNFASSKRCLEEVVYIMNTQNSCDTSDASPKPTILPIFYNVEPSTVRHQLKGYDLKETPGSTQEERERWASALRQLSLLHGFEYKTDSEYQFQWETLYDIVKNVEMSAKTVIPCNDGRYVEKVNQVLKMLELQEKSEDVSFVGIYGRNKSEFANILVKRLAREFGRVCHLTNVMEKACQPDGISNIVKKMCLDLIKSDDVRICQQLLENERCLVLLDDLGNDIDMIRPLVEEVKAMLGNGSLLVLANQFQHVLRQMNVHKLIDLTLEHKRGILQICYAEGDGINDGFLIQLRETFDMLGLDVRLLNRDQVKSGSTCPQNAKVVLCIISRSFSSGDFNSMFENAILPSKIVCISYGSDLRDEGIPELFFKMEVDFRKRELDKDQFRWMVQKVVQILNERPEEIIKSAVDFPVGLAERSNNIERCILDAVSMSDQSLQCFGLVGMGGVGKTTLAMSIYNKIHSKFEGSFLSFNTRSEVQGKGSLGLVALQKKMLANLMRSNEDVLWINNYVHGKDVLKKKLKNINALVILDDVDDEEQLDALYQPLRSSLGPKSAVIITTRDRKILEWAKSRKIFDVQGLDKEMSKWLFYWHAFMKPKPPVDHEEVSERVIEACNGLPLALKVVGSHLYSKSDKSYWEESFHYLQRNKHKLFDVLRISFDGLDDYAKEAFLDICCFLIDDEDQDFVCAVLKACYGMGRTYLHELQNKCLITTYVDEDEDVRRIRVHDQLRDMGRQIVRQDRRDRAWNEETANDILQDERARSSLRGLSIRGHIPLPVEALDCRCLPQLRILVVKEDWRYRWTERGEYFPQNVFTDVRCGGLRWLRWQLAPFQQLPHGLCSPDIRVLELRHSNLSEVPMDSLPKLQHLDLTGCKGLKTLDSSIARMTDLKYLNLSECPHITRLPNDMTSVSSLQHLVLHACVSVTTLFSLPTTLRTLTLEMKSNEVCSLESLENSALPHLQELTITHCNKLKRLSLDAPSLQRVALQDCIGLEQLDCKGFSSLKYLDLNRCSSLTTLSSLPTTVRNLTFSGEMCVYACVENASLPHLEELTINACRNLRRFSLQATSLQRLRLYGCGLEDLETRGLSSLQLLQLYHCRTLKSLVLEETSLQVLDFLFCDGLEELDGKGLSSLQSLQLKYCHNLKRLAVEAPSLQRLSLMDFWQLQEFNCKGLSSLKQLELTKCTSLKALRSLPTTLQRLRLRHCAELESVDVRGCTCLSYLYISDCNGLTPSNISGSDRLTSEASVEINVR
ncbi:hypothetical protein KP509_08G025300 [Ceratopteris richardii]|uniref:TIR domain-containing protein n=1 Tax=Ceratopteris richardii TaxID=49495 RepID=A0A8T2UEY4_CERRI|nr:hypothetical protein KP509_08G025300 [Ceratopteris richardii]